jgi:hypothetical protein
MARARSVLTTESEFDTFLYASIGVESDGTFPSVLSTLARLNLDPWDEAARLGRLPREAASRFLANLISTQPGAAVAGVDSQIQAERLTALLPSHAAGTRHPNSVGMVGDLLGDRSRLIRYAIYYVVLAIVFFGSQWVVQNWRGGKSSGTAAVAPTGANVAPTPEQPPAPKRD